MTTSIERNRVEQSNEVASIVFDEHKKAFPDLHPVLNLRYGIADALWDAGYRKATPPAGNDYLSELEKAARLAFESPDFSYGMASKRFKLLATPEVVVSLVESIREIESRMSLLLDEATGSHLSKPGYDVATMVGSIRAHYRREFEAEMVEESE